MIIKDVNVSKLHTEINAKGIYPHPVIDLENGEGDFTFVDDVDMDYVQSIIDAHDPTPIPQPLSEFELLKEQNVELRGTIDFILTELIPSLFE